jgi:hypothetical protein
MVIQGPGALGDEPVEASDLGDLLVGLHCLTLVRNAPAVQACGVLA